MPIRPLVPDNNKPALGASAAPVLPLQFRRLLPCERAQESEAVGGVKSVCGELPLPRARFRRPLKAATFQFGACGFVRLFLKVYPEPVILFVRFNVPSVKLPSGIRGFRFTGKFFNPLSDPAYFSPVVGELPRKVGSPAIRI